MFSVLVKVDVLLHTAFSSTDVAADTYTVAGPEDVTTLLRTTLQKAEHAQSPRKMSKAHTDHGSRRGVLTGRMSPLTPVTVPPVARAAAGIRSTRPTSRSSTHSKAIRNLFSSLIWGDTRGASSSSLEASATLTAAESSSRSMR